MRPGDQVQELELAASMAEDVPRVALMRLTQEQLMSRSGRRYRARVFSPAEIRHFYEMPRGLEQRPCRPAADWATDAELAALLGRAEGFEVFTSRLPSQVAIHCLPWGAAACSSW